MNHAQAVILSKLTDNEILTLHPDIARRHLPVLREWAKVGGEVEHSGTSGYWFKTNKPDWTAVNYRLAVRRIEITGPGGTYSYPEPLREAPANGALVYGPSLLTGFITCRFHAAVDSKHVAAGLLHLTREAAEEHARSLILAGGGAV